MQKSKKEQHDQISVFRPYTTATLATAGDKTVKNKVTQIGAKIKVKWTKEETTSMGWYVATVQSYCADTDMITLTYQCEPNDPYEEELTPLIAEGKLKLMWSPI